MKLDREELQKAVNSSEELKTFMKTAKTKVPFGVRMASSIANNINGTNTNEKYDSNGYISLFDYYGLKDKESNLNTDIETYKQTNVNYKKLYEEEKLRNEQLLKIIESLSKN